MDDQYEYINRWTATVRNIPADEKVGHTTIKYLAIILILY